VEPDRDRCPPKNIFATDAVTMENTDFSATNFESLSDSPKPADAKLLNRYSAHLLTDEIPWRRRTLMLEAARQFLDWWRERYGEDKYHACPAAENRSDHESLWSVLRETYLRYAWPDREMREGERGLLNPFLRFIDAASTAVRCEPVEDRLRLRTRVQS
jgi:hypothetical protein